MEIDRNDSPCKDGNAQFTIVPFKALSVQVCSRYLCYSFFKLFIFICGFSARVTCAFLACRSCGEIKRNKQFLSDKKNMKAIIIFDHVKVYYLYLLFIFIIYILFLIMSRFHEYHCKSGIAIFGSCFLYFLSGSNLA